MGHLGDFVSSCKERIEQAKADWQNGRIHLPRNEDQEFIPYTKAQDGLQSQRPEPDPLCDGYIDAGTSMNASIAAQLILKYPKKPGVYAAESYFDREAYLREVEKRRFSVSKTVEYLD